MRRRNVGARPPCPPAAASNRASKSSDTRRLRLATGPLHVVIRRREGYPALDSDDVTLAPPLGGGDA